MRPHEALAASAWLPLESIKAQAEATKAVRIERRIHLTVMTVA
jgi:hypothetical protein